VGALGTSGEDAACIMIYSAGPSERDHSRGNIRILALVDILCGSGSWVTVTVCQAARTVQRTRSLEEYPEPFVPTVALDCGYYLR